MGCINLHLSLVLYGVSALTKSSSLPVASKPATGDDGAVSSTTYWIVLPCFVLFSVANIIVTYVCALLKLPTRGVCDSDCNCTPIVVNKICLKQTMTKISLFLKVVRIHQHIKFYLIISMRCQENAQKLKICPVSLSQNVTKNKENPHTAT